MTTITAWDEVTLEFPSRSMPVVLAGDGRSVVGLRFGPAADHAAWLGEAPRDPADPVVAAAASQLRSYAAGRAESFDVPLSLEGSQFQQAVWKALLDIPYGSTTTYGALAAAIGRPGQARAIGGAVGSNPVGIIVPCHRVIGANGSLTGFGGGLDNKVALLAREGVTAL
ncbi:MAG TPA: methylated-DNA--[protein]-cysteine S-methyltransferase [Acidimicrobiales bacterium]|nr:methylated-DNA--[protein]-cysteine S-methyltransferase [Acidimicrobiales bacterium]